MNALVKRNFIMQLIKFLNNNNNYAVNVTGSEISHHVRPKLYYFDLLHNSSYLPVGLHSFAL